MMRIRFLVLFLILFSVSSVHAMPEEAAFGLEQNSKEWKKKEFEDWITNKIVIDLSQFVPAELFKVYVDAEFKNPKNYSRKISNVNLSMLGTVATIVETEKARPQLGLFDRIEKLNLTLVVADSVPEKTVEAMLTVIAKRVPLLNSNRLNMQVVSLERPSLTFTQWLKEFQGVIGGLFALAIACFAAFKILQKVRIRGSLQFGPANTQEHEHVEKHSDAEADSHESTSAIYNNLPTQVKKQSSTTTAETIHKLGLNLDQVDPASEGQFLNVLLMKAEFANFAQLVRHSLPVELLQFAPDEAIKATIAHMSHSDRLDVLAFAPKELEVRIWLQLPKPMQEAREMLLKDVERLRSSIRNEALAPQQAYGRFMKIIREAIRKNKTWSKAIQPHVEHWIFVKTKGIEGRPHGTKVA